MNFEHFRKRVLKQRRFKELMVLSVVLSLLMGIAIVPLERHAEQATIQTWSDGLWWSIQTLTTVGYGDVTPVTDVGRIVGVAMQILGAVIFGTLIAIIGSSMSRGQEEFFWNRLFERLDRLERKVDELEKHTSYMIKQDVHEQKEES